MELDLEVPADCQWQSKGHGPALAKRSAPHNLEDTVGIGLTIFGRCVAQESSHELLEGAKPSPPRQAQWRSLPTDRLGQLSQMFEISLWTSVIL
jgi:hypothetical protein